MMIVVAVVSFALGFAAALAAVIMCPSLRKRMHLVAAEGEIETRCMQISTGRGIANAIQRFLDQEHLGNVKMHRLEEGDLGYSILVAWGSEMGTYDFGGLAYFGFKIVRINVDFAHKPPIEIIYGGGKGYDFANADDAGIDRVIRLTGAIIVGFVALEKQQPAKA